MSLSRRYLVLFTINPSLPNQTTSPRALCVSLFFIVLWSNFARLCVGCRQGILNFDCTTCYVPLKTLAVGTLCKLCGVEPDVATLAMHLSLAPALLQLVYSDTSTVYLKVRVFRLSQRCVFCCVGFIRFNILPQVLAPFPALRLRTSVFVDRVPRHVYVSHLDIQFDKIGTILLPHAATVSLFVISMP